MPVNFMENEAIQTIADLANIHPDEQDAMRQFREKHQMEDEFSANAFSREKRYKYGRNSDERVLFFQDLAHRLWYGGDRGGIDLLRELLLSDGKIDVTIDWLNQGFAYQPKTRLQSAFYALLTNSHLAKRCANTRCHQFFIGARVDERYCSDECRNVGRLSSKKNWLNANRVKSARGKK
jgi:hypothetical protein